MNNSWFVCTLIGLLLGIASPSKGQQLTELAADSAAFNEQFETHFLERTDLTESREKVLNQFIDQWNRNQIPANEKLMIRHISNELLGKKASTFPHLYDFFHLYLSLNQKSPALKEEWFNHYMRIIRESDKELSALYKIIRFSLQLINQNALYASPSNSWYINSEDYQFGYGDDFTVAVTHTDLTCQVKDDSIRIHNTSGKYFLFENTWHGKKGKVTYTRAGYPADSVYATLAGYRIQLQKPEYEADSVLLTHKYYFDKPLQGRLKDRVMNIRKPVNAFYPEFNSYQTDFHIRDIYPDINYDGGFIFQGAKVIGSSNNGKEDVFLQLFNNNQPILTLTSRSIFFYKDRVISNRSEIIFKLNKDSIYHPNLKFTYYVNRQQLSILRNDDFISQTPYFNSYHQVAMNFEQLLWDCNTPEVKFTALQTSAIGRASFESSNYFNNREYYRLQRRDPVHPLIRLRDYSRKVKKESFPVLDYAGHLRLPASQIRHQLMELTVEGYLIFDTETDMIHLNDKLFTEIKAHYDQIDYDIINIVSETDVNRENAILDLNSFDLNINGVERIFLSDSQKVSIAPYGKEITLKKDRDFEFDGIVLAGLFRFYGDSFAFSYDNFKIDLGNVDSLNMMAQSEERDFYNDPVLVRINNTMENISGNLLIDDPANKAGLEKFPKYPVFNSVQTSYVYYDDPHIQGGVYPREDFYFQIYPYQLDSLDNFNPDNLKFEGEFHSSDIFPTFEEDLVIMPDNSLGFVRKTPEPGFPVYRGKGRFFRTIRMSNEGLWGDGELTYANSTTRSDDMLFHPEALTTTARSFEVEERTTGVEFPSVRGSNNDVEWLPYEEELRTSSNEEPLAMINNNASLEGSLLMKSTGITGTGTMKVKNAELRSEGFYYEASSFRTDESSFLIRDKENQGVLFRTDQVISNIDFREMKGTFKPLEEISEVRFSENQYIGLIENFQWGLNEESISMLTEATRSEYLRGEIVVERIPPTAGIPSGCHFFSTHPQQDSLDFYSPTASFDLTNKVLHADQVHHIRVADALIYPEDQEVRILKQAKMEPLYNSEVRVTVGDKNHEFHNATLNVKGKYDYQGSGTYLYVDANGVNQKITMDEIWVNDSLHTASKGTITEQDKFRLSPNFEFMGTASMVGSSKHLTFDGATRINHQCNQLAAYWVKFKNLINPSEIYIPISEQPKNLNNSKLYTGAFYATDSMHMYPAFLSGRKAWSDHLLFSSHGYLYYNKSSDRYIISSKEKINDPDIPGSLVSLHRNFCFLHGEGPVDFGVDLGQVDLHTVGDANVDMGKNSISMDLVMGLEFFMHNRAMDIMAQQLDTLPLDPVNIASNSYATKIQELLGQEQAEELRNEALREGEYSDLPEILDKTLVFNELNMAWNQPSQSFRSTGKIGVSVVNGRQVNKYVEGTIEVIPYRSGDRIIIYLKAGEDHWYYFSYMRGVMYTHASNQEYVDLVRDERSRKRKMKVDRGEPSYFYILSTESSLSKTLARFNQEGGSEETSGENAEKASGETKENGEAGDAQNEASGDSEDAGSEPAAQNEASRAGNPVRDEAQ